MSKRAQLEYLDPAPDPPGKRGPIIVMCSDLTLPATCIVELYCRRSAIENTFSVLKNRIEGLAYRFWSKLIEKGSRRPKKNKSKHSKTTYFLRSYHSIGEAEHESIDIYEHECQKSRTDSHTVLINGMVRAPSVTHEFIESQREELNLRPAALNSFILKVFLLINFLLALNALFLLVLEIDWKNKLLKLEI